MKKKVSEAMKRDFVAALRIIHHEGLSDAFAHLSARLDDGKTMLFMPSNTQALVNVKHLYLLDFEKRVTQ